MKKRGFWKKFLDNAIKGSLLAYTTAVVIVCGLVENVDGLYSIDYNIDTVNALASEIFSSLALIAANGVGAPVEIPNDTLAAVPAPDGVKVDGAAGPWGLVDPASTNAIIGFPELAVAHAAGPVPVHIRNARIAASRLIVAAGWCANCAVNDA
ncbi:MAG: hypothetical protein LBS33_02340 [Streptococcaceae bacterium]|nr:hypothetical protein [Streptococcaceae bacterium]